MKLVKPVLLARWLMLAALTLCASMASGAKAD